MRRTRFALAAAALLAAGCGEGDQQAPAETTPAAPEPNAGATAPNPPPAGDSPGHPGPPDDSLGSDRVMQGSWSSKTMAGHPAVLFGQPQTEAAFSIRCEEGELVLARSLRRPAGTVAMTVMAGGQARALQAISRPDPMPAITARLDASDALAAELMTTREAIAVRIGDGQSFRMPASGALRRLVGDCRG